MLKINCPFNFLNKLDTATQQLAYAHKFKAA
jgi:hypothetical protein